MEFDYELNRADRLLFDKEFKKEKCILPYLKLDKSLHSDMLFCGCVLSYFYCAFFEKNPSFTAFVIWLIIFAILALILKVLCIYLFPLDTSRTAIYKKDVKGRINFSYENVNIYTGKKFFSFNTLQIERIFETDNFYSFIIKHYPCYYGLILPKRLLSYEQKQELAHFINHYRNKDKEIQGLAINIRHSVVFISVVVCFIAAFIFFPFVNRYGVGIGIKKAPIIKVYDNSVAQLMGLDTDDLILEINGKNMINQPPILIKKLIAESKDIEIKVWKTRLGKIKTYKMTR